MTELTEERADPWHISLLKYWHISWKDALQNGQRDGTNSCTRFLMLFFFKRTQLLIAKGHIAEKLHHESGEVVLS